MRWNRSADARYDVDYRLAGRCGVRTLAREAQSVNGKPGQLPPPHGLYDPQCEHDACGVGFVAHIKGKRSHRIITQALDVLRNLEHRGASGCDPETGDGAGILMQIPHAFFAAQMAHQGVALPPPGHYGVGMLFLPTDAEERARIESLFTQVTAEEGYFYVNSLS
jgi:glutamate synthase (NADPH) large chain